jgi:predicted esterase
MRSYKRRVDSALLKRWAHADLFEVGDQPQFLFILFGGSGVDEDEYAQRGETVIPVFGPTLDWLTGRGIALVLAHVTAPYDVPFRQFPTDPTAAATWNAHVLTELLEPWAGLPYFVAGFSGGAVLALHGLHANPRCFGAATLGGDAIPPDFERPGHWAEKLRLYAAADDRVCNHPANWQRAEFLERRGVAEQLELRSGAHRLGDYSTPACLGELLCFAARIVPGS